MHIKRFMSKKVVAIGLAAGVTLGIGGAAFAYFTAGGTGTGSATTGSSSAMTLVQDTTINSAQLVPGYGPQTIMGHQYNSAGTTEYVGAVTPTITSVTETPGAVIAWGVAPYGAGGLGVAGTVGNYTCSTSDYTLASTAAAGDEVVGPNAVQATSSSNDFSLGTIGFNDTGVNQDACEGATVALGFSS